MQSKIGQGWRFLVLQKRLLVSFRFGVDIIQWLLYNVIGDRTDVHNTERDVFFLTGEAGHPFLMIICGWPF